MNINVKIFHKFLPKMCSNLYLILKEIIVRIQNHLTIKNLSTNLSISTQCLRKYHNTTLLDAEKNRCKNPSSI